MVFSIQIFVFAAVSATVAVAASAEAEILAESKLYFQGNPISVVTPMCLAWGLFCPPGFSIPGSSPAGPPADLSKQRQDALANGNAYRGSHGAAPLTVDPTVREQGFDSSSMYRSVATLFQLEAEAQAYAEQLAATGTFQHSVPGGRYGENLARLPSPGTIAQANTAWYGEKPLYCPGAGSVNAASGHFTQLVWKGSTTVGYGSAVGKDGYTYVVARYAPPGNVMGAEAANISC